MTLKILMVLAVAFVIALVTQVDGKLYPVAENVQDAASTNHLDATVVLAASKPATRKLGQPLVSDEDFRALMEQRETAEVCDSTCNIYNTYHGSCSGLFEKTDKWCTRYGKSVCCAGSSSDCCKLSSGSVLLFVVIGWVAVTFIVIASCSCCRCCPWHRHLCCAPKTPRETGEPPVVQLKGTRRMESNADTDADDEA
jgi:hypothetical protein